MHRIRRNAFTLVEILIVVVILGILAAIVIPQFTKASESAVRSTLKSQLQTIVSQVELYRVRNRGVYPTLGDGQANDGWGVLISESYIKEPPLNSYVGMYNLITGTDAFMTVARDSATAGWATDGDGNFWASGYDPTPVAGFPDGKLQHE
ncbi:MAG: type II secretion system protein [Phycisphaeraceae bacterium]|nr:type II secretion system protein [Phycisphaeraceae bacterium]